MDSNGQLWEIDWRDIEIAMERDPGGRTVTHKNRDILLLTAEDCVWLWINGIGTGEG